MTERLPLFPLNTVLYPGLVLPLNIFEERYRQLARDLLELPEDERRFGVVGIRAGRETGELPGEPVDALFAFGCTAQVATLTPHPDGGFDLVATGSTRFRLVSVDASGPYLVGEIETLPEESGAEAPVLAAAAVRAFGTYQRRLLAAQRRTPTALPELPDDPVVLSYLIASAMVLDPRDKQTLLAVDDVRLRLRAEIRLLRREARLVELTRSLPAVELVRQDTHSN